MKIKPEHLWQLQEAVIQVVRDHQIPQLATYLDHGLLERRWRWDVFHKACDMKLVNPSELYAYLNDDHIDTALRHCTATR